MDTRSLSPKLAKRKVLEWYRARRLDEELRTRRGVPWQRMEPGRFGLYDAGAVQIGRLLYVFGGYLNLGKVNENFEIYDLEADRWIDTIPLVEGMPQSHFAAATDGKRFIYIASGQLGAECSPAVPDVFSFDVKCRTWQKLPDLPQARYAGTMQIWRGRLHFVGGAGADRWTPKGDHWSIAVGEGVATDTHWRPETAIPTPGMHRGSVLVDDNLYVVGGQQGDFMAIEGDPDFRCTGRTQETYLSDCFRLDEPSGEWSRLADMPIASSHNDFSVIFRDGQILSVGGQIYKDQETFELRLTDAIQSYDVVNDRWSVSGHLPFRLKLPSVGVWDDRICVFGGQRGKKDTDRPGPIVKDTWRGQLSGLASPEYSTNGAFSGKRVLMLTHDLSRTGAPLLLCETAQMLMRQGACVQLATASDDINGYNLAAEFDLPLIPIEAAPTVAQEVDVIIANTVAPPVAIWVRKLLDQNPDLAQKLVWWVHEIDVEHFLPHVPHLQDAKLVIFDSHACRDAWQKKIGKFSAAAVVHPGLSDHFVKIVGDDEVSQSTNKCDDKFQYNNSALRRRARQQLGIGADEFLVCSIGTIEPRKGQRLLLRTLSNLAHDQKLPIKVLLVGFRNKRHRARFLRKLTRAERAIAPKKLMFVKQADIAQFYLAADAFVLNTQGIDAPRGECFGRVTIEAMAAGTATIGTEAGGTMEILKHSEIGLLFPTGEDGQADLAKHVADLIRDPHRRDTIAKAGQKHALEYFRQKRFQSDFENALTQHLDLDRQQMRYSA